MTDVSRLRKAVTAGVVILKYIDGSLRIAVARDPEKGQDKWVLPKGHVRDGESIADTAVREAREETGASEIVLLTYLGFFERRSLEDWGEWVSKTIHLFLGYSFGPVDITPKPFETVVESRWLPVSDAIEKLPWVADRTFLRGKLTPLLNMR